MAQFLFQSSLHSLEGKVKGKLVWWDVDAKVVAICTRHIANASGMAGILHLDSDQSLPWQVAPSHLCFLSNTRLVS